MKRPYNVIIPVQLKPQPDKWEVMVARILAKKFQSDVEFVERNTLSTPDVQVLRTRQFWEIKNITSDGKYTIEDNLRRAAKQANNVVISLLRAKMTKTQAITRIQHYLKHAHGNIRQVILVTKDQKTLVFTA